MAIIRWQPFQDLDKFFEDLQLVPFFRNGTDLAADVYEEGNNIIVEMQIPGIDADNINISVQDDYLRVGGVREEKKEVEKKHYYTKEIRRGSFERLIALPAPVIADQARAEFKDGTLKISLPKKQQQQEQKIKIEKK